MKKAVLLLLLLAGFAPVSADTPTDAPEFYFTRLAYTENPTGC